MQGLPLADCFRLYTLLSIGDGLVTQIPTAIIISVAAGLLVTRASADSDLGSYLGKQLTFYRRPIMIAGCFLLFFAAVGGLAQRAPFFVLGTSCLIMAYIMKKGIGGANARAEAFQKQLAGAQAGQQDTLGYLVNLPRLLVLVQLHLHTLKLLKKRLRRRSMLILLLSRLAMAYCRLQIVSKGVIFWIA